MIRDSLQRKSRKDSIKETTQVQEVSGYIDMSEDELLQKLNMDKMIQGFIQMMTILILHV